MMTLTRTLSTLRPATFTAPLLIAALLLSACSGQKKADRVTFDGHLFRASAKKVDKQRFDFEVTVRPVSASLEGARNAGRYEATRYCIGNFGSSEVAWTDGPDAEDGRLRVSNDSLLLRGRCTAR